MINFELAMIQEETEVILDLLLEESEGLNKLGVWIIQQKKNVDISAKDKYDELLKHYCTDEILSKVKREDLSITYEKALEAGENPSAQILKKFIENLDLQIEKLQLLELQNKELKELKNLYEVENKELTENKNKDKDKPKQTTLAWLWSGVSAIPGTIQKRLGNAVNDVLAPSTELRNTPSNEPNNNNHKRKHSK